VEEDAESVLNTALASYVYPRFSDLVRHRVTMYEIRSVASPSLIGLQSAHLR